MTRSPTEIEREARDIGARAKQGSLSDNTIIQILCALVEELSDNVERLRSEVDTIKAMLKKLT